MSTSFLPSLDNKRKLTEQQQTFLSVLATSAKGDINKALNIAGYKETSYYNVINSLKHFKYNNIVSSLESGLI